MSKYWKILNAPFTLIVLGFLLSTWLGGYLTTKLQEESWARQKHFEMSRQDFEWEREKKFEILRRKLDEGQHSLEEISDLINTRYMRMHSVFEAIIKRDGKLVYTKWKKYMVTVEEWNVKLIINQNKLKRLVSSSISAEFQNYETDNIEIKPVSIHGKFFHAHLNLLKLMKCMKNLKCSLKKIQIDETNIMLRDLDIHTDDFVDRVSDTFLDRATDLENFKAIDASHNK